MQYTANTLEKHWMPFTANRDFKADPRLIVRGEGVYYWDHKGGKILDGSSGLFCSAAGHCRPEIADAVEKQLRESDFVPPFQSGHPGSFELAQKISRLTPDGIDHVFFANSGSEAVDTALKIAMAYHHARGEGQRTRFVTRERAYHGVNIGGMSLSGMAKNREAFSGFMPDVVHMRHTWLEENRFAKGQPEEGAFLADDLEGFAQSHGGDTIAACFVEPIAGSTGCLVPPVGYLERLREICDTHGIVLVFDEVICGFGRTGKAFAAQSFGVTPDIITMAKAMTNGAVPMAAVAVKDEIYDTIVDVAPENAIEFFHGYTYSGHPVACAAALAALDIYEKENLFERAAELSPYFLDKVFELQDLDAVTDIRGYGLIAGIDVAAGDVPGARGAQIQKDLFWNGLHVKFTADTGIVAPPFIAEKKHIDQIVAGLRAAIDEAA